ncbi:NBP2 [Candida theae]|uniref:NBP2 n=1 Tax=Candida theae TaxID=1198502 RepID=A0AAD5FXD1_9ASCO|nr:NBP2 [Candida theae]KAI5952186.1 NBP2 [Candida theae]
MGPRFPPNTKIKDFGYPESHPLHYVVSLNHSRSSQLLIEDDDESDEEVQRFSDNTSTISSSDGSYHRSRHHESLRHDKHEGYEYEYEYEYDNEGHDTYDDYADLEDDYDDDDYYEKDEINCEARAIFDFQPENDNEIGLSEGQVIWISYRHGQGWLVAEDPETGENGLVPEEYVELIGLLRRGDPDTDADAEDEAQRREVEEDVAKPFLPEILRNDEPTGDVQKSDDDWVDTDYESSKSNIDTIEDLNDKELFVDALDKSIDKMKI